MTTLQSARERYIEQQEITADAVASARRLRFDSLGRLVAVVAGFQAAAAVRGSRYVPQALTEQGIDTDRFATPDARTLAGWTAYGAPLAPLLDKMRHPRIDSIRFDRLIASQVQDAGRNGEELQMAVTPAVTTYVRMLNPPSCSRCVLLAGKKYRKNEGFARHPLCFPAGVVVSGPATEGATRRHYEGELVVLTTASGQELPLTGNHPVLTRRGWVPANLIQEGDEVFRSTRPEGASALVVPHHDQVPSRIEDIWGALSVTGLDAVESSPEHFHGDGQHGQVDVVRAYGSLDDRLLAAGLHEAAQEHLTLGARSPLSFNREGAAQILDLRHSSKAGGLVSGDHLSLALRSRHPGVSHPPRLGRTAALDASLYQALGYDAPTHSVLGGERVLARAGFVGGHDVGHRQVERFPRWDAPSGPLSVETAEGYARQGRDVLDRLAGQVEPDRVVKVLRREFRGHVYSLTSSEGWHSANSLIVSNCDCVHVPTDDEKGDDVRFDPVEYFDSLPTAEQLAEEYPHLTVKMRREAGIYSQEDVFTKHGAELIRAAPQGKRQYVMGRTVNTRWMKHSTAGEDARRRAMPGDMVRRAGGDRVLLLRLMRSNGYIRY